MKDSEFLELLNLYLDHEISAADAARLEAEVQNNRDRRATYREYCRMQKACKCLVADFQGEGETSASVAASTKLVSLEAHAARWPRRVGLYAAGAAALAAACVTLIFVGRGHRQPDASVAVAPAPSAVEKPATKLGAATDRIFLAAESSALHGPAAVAGAPGRNERLKVTLVSDSLILSGSKQAEAVLAAAVQQADDQLAWMRNFQLAPLQERKQLEPLLFDAAPLTLRPEGRQLGGRAPAEATVEMTAFRFVK